MQQRLFRKSALERLSSPEQLDQLMTVTSPRAWLALLGLMVVLASVVVWGFVGSIPTTVAGEGILLRGGEGISSISAPVAGRLSDIYVSVDDIIENGQVLARIQREDTGENARLIANQPGRIIEIRVSQDDFVSLGDPMIILEPTGDDVIDLEAIIYLPATEGKNVRPGMRVQIAPTTVQVEESGVMLGWVKAVGEFPESRESVARVLENPELVERFFTATDGAPIEVRVDLIPSRETVSGFKWSSPQGPDVEIRSGTLASANIIIQDEPPVNLIFPGLMPTG